jgi:Heterokaryon incompatibility protein (HET)
VEDDNRPIFIDGMGKSVKRNLYTAIQQLRQKTRPFTIWIDALCINQSDIQERNSQVLIMHKIYASAGFVIAWLGSDEDPALGQTLPLGDAG